MQTKKDGKLLGQDNGNTRRNRKRRRACAPARRSRKPMVVWWSHAQLLQVLPPPPAAPSLEAPQPPAPVPATAHSPPAAHLEAHRTLTLTSDPPSRSTSIDSEHQDTMMLFMQETLLSAYTYKRKHAVRLVPRK